MSLPLPFHRHRFSGAASTLLLILLANPADSIAATPAFQSLDLEDLLKIRVVGASKYEQAQTEVPAAVAVITQDEIRRFGWRTLGEALQTLPGVYSTYSRQYAQVGTRGLGLPGDFNTRLLVTINGNRLNDPVYDGAPSGRDFPLDLDLVERIEFIPGPGSAVYGQNAMFGVVNVITRKGADLDSSDVALRLQQPGNLREGRLSWGGVLDDGLDVLLSLSALGSRGEDLALSYGESGIAGVARDMDGERNIRGFARVGRGNWQFEWTHGSRRKDEATGPYRSDPLVRGQYEHDTYSLGQFRYQSTLADHWAFKARLFAGVERYESRLRYGSWLRGFGAGDWWGTELQWDTSVREAHHLLLGVEYQNNRHAELGARYESQAQADFRNEAPSHRLGLFAQDEWRIRQNLIATLGARLDHNADGSTLLNPRTALIWHASPRTTLKALYGTANRRPNTNESAYEDGVSFIANRQLSGEKMQTFEMIAESRPTESLMLRTSLFRWSLNDLIILGNDAATGLLQYQSGPRAHAEGVEFSGDQVWEGGIRLRGSASYSNASFSNQQPSVNSPRWMARGLLSLPLHVAGLQLSYETRYDDERLGYAGSRTGGQWLSDVGLGTSTWLPGTEVSVKLRNLFDRRYAHPVARTNWQQALEQDGFRLALLFRTSF